MLKPWMYTSGFRQALLIARRGVILELIESSKVACDTTAPGLASSSSYIIKSLAVTLLKLCGLNVITCLSGKRVGLAQR